MTQTPLFFIVFLISICSAAQKNNSHQTSILVKTNQQIPIPGATVAVLNIGDSSLVSAGITDTSGLVVFRDIITGNYFCRITAVNYETIYTSIHIQSDQSFSKPILLQPAPGVLKDVTVTAKKDFVRFLPDKTVVNVEAGITNTGATVMEALEKSPGITIDKDGNISLKGRAGVRVLIDGKPVQLAGVDLQNLLTGMSASSVEEIELIDNPPAKYDAAGNAGIINIKTKKSKQKGFNGSISTAYGQGRYSKNNNNLLLNYRSGSFNYFLNYSLNMSKGFTDLYALRTYFKQDGSIDALLEQPYYTKGSGYTHTLRAGMDYFMNQKTTVGFSINGLDLSRDYKGLSTAKWLNASGIPDSMINTDSHNTNRWQHGGININGTHKFNDKQELTGDIDCLVYEMHSNQLFENKLATPGSNTDASKGLLPSAIHIFSAKADYTQQLNSVKWESGWKSSHVTTDNLARYYYLENNDWKDDAGKSNHFLYSENIHALYSNVETKKGKWNLQAGLRYEYTGYHAKQLGNAVVKDSSFNRNYQGIFPTTFITFQADTVNSFTLTAGRRIDRPAFQSLNPFVYIINKYTLQQGNPYFRPQYTWNIELTHLYKEFLSTSIHYNITKDYMSQIFLSDTSSGTIVYTEGNVGRFQYFGLSISLQASPASWWSLSGQADLTHKKIQGYLWNNYKASINQFTVSLNNQFKLKKGWTGELTGFYISKNQNDLQEVLDPTGQVSAGIAKQVLKNKGTFKLALRDIFYTQAMQGLTHFQFVNEYFKLQRDTRVCTLSFTYRFGKTMKQAVKRSTGGAEDEINRVGNSN